MKDAYRLSSTPTTLRVQIERLDEFDLSVFSIESKDLFLESIKQNRIQGFVEYSKKDWVGLDYFLAHSHFSKREAYCFLASLFQRLTQALKNQPVILDLQAIFLSPNGDEVRFCRAPLIFETWMKRQGDIEWFLNSLLHLFPSDSLEILGLLWKGATGKERFENLSSILEDLYQENAKKSLFARRKAIPPYCAKKPICIPEEAISTVESTQLVQGTPFVKEWEKRLPQSAQTLLNQEDQDCVSFDSSSTFEFNSKELGPNSTLSNLEVLEKAALFDLQEPKDVLLEKQENGSSSKQMVSFSKTKLESKKNSPFETLSVKEENDAAFPKRDPILDSSFSNQSLQAQPLNKKERSKRASSKLNKTAPLFETNPLETATVVLEEWIAPCFLEIQGQTHMLKDQEVFVGRQRGCHIRLEDPSVSSMHAKLTCQEERWYIQDLKSTNFTWLNDKRVIRKMRLKEGMVIRFGQCEAIFHQPLPKA